MCAKDGFIDLLSGEYDLQLCDRAWLHCTDLPGDTPSAAAQMPDGLHVFIDLAKPDAYAHAREMLRAWLGIDLTRRHGRVPQLVPAAD